MTLGVETAKALGEVGKKYEGTLKEQDGNVYIELTWKRKLSKNKLLIERSIPSDAFLRDLFLAYHIRNLAEQLDKLTQTLEKGETK